MRRLETALQRYAWGKSGSDSMVARLKKVRKKGRRAHSWSDAAILVISTNTVSQTRLSCVAVLSAHYERALGQR